MEQKKTPENPASAENPAKAAWVPAILSAVIALVVWSSSRRTDIHMGGGFEGEGEDISVLWTELPFVLLAAGVLPVVVWLLTVRVLRGSMGRGGLVMTAAVAATAVTLLYAWGLYTWADHLDPEHVRSIGSQLHL
ncbi:hypothetical protein [Streptomyces sp. NBC_01012]|uniref:hypothetical protein n=1 Tax=Streptomyces sp. NBC_01012 TaxID=2903717 RepID=UPI003868C344|nr:hypothetical protein OG623_18360 [Streptomyces sp. NBC_01012]